MIIMKKKKCVQSIYGFLDLVRALYCQPVHDQVQFMGWHDGALLYITARAMPYHAIACFTLHFQRISLFITHTQSPVLVLTCVASIFLTQLFVNVISARYQRLTIFVKYHRIFKRCPFLRPHFLPVFPASEGKFFRRHCFAVNFSAAYFSCFATSGVHRSVVRLSFCAQNSFLPLIWAARLAEFAWAGNISSSNVRKHSNSCLGMQV